MIGNLTKAGWLKFSRIFGSSIIHPQFLLIKFQREAVEEVKKYAKGNLVDIGCGRMPYRKELEPLVDSYIGVDHPNVSRLYTSDKKPEVFADAKKLPLKSNFYDTAILLQVLEHVDLPDRVIEEAARVLKPNGVLILSVPFLYPLHDMPYDWGRYSSTALRSFVKQAGLRVVKMRVQGGFFEFWLQMLNTFLVKRINDIILSKFNLYSIVLLIVTMAFSLPVILFNNLLIVVALSVSRVLPKYPDYFPLDYLIVARKKS